MIKPVSLDLFNNRKIYFNKTQTRPQNLSKSLSLNAHFDYLKSNALFFKGQINNNDFQETIDKNYFKLPMIKTKNGRTIQAKPDNTQLACAKSLYEGANTVCIAPTGTGKTAIANYAITKNLSEGKRTIYTTPLKALSNDKYREFSKIYGEENVGLLTGDIKLKKDAPIVIMTTEIYRNMALGAYADTNDEDRFNNVKTVIFDEAHYLNEEERGKIWEESILLTPKNIQILPLSATIGNAREFSLWVQNVFSKDQQGEFLYSPLMTNLVEASPKNRHVPLVYYNYTGQKDKPFVELIRGKVDVNQLNEKLSQRQIRALDMLYQAKYNEDDDYSTSEAEKEEIINDLKAYTNKQKMPHVQFAKIIQSKFKLKELKAQEITQLLIDSDTKSINPQAERSAEKQDKKSRTNDYKELVRNLKNDNKLPALVFIFSRMQCNDTAALVADSGLNLTTQKEKEEIQEIIKNYKEQGIYLGSNFSEKELIQGVASHHAGLLPSYKKLVEELFSKKLIKAVFATSTLSAGINMPAKTVVITSITHPHKAETGEIEYMPLTSNEFHQMSGRAGRRGIDTIGNVVLYNLRSDDENIAKSLILSPPDNIESKYNPNYSFLTSYYQKYQNDDILKYFQANTFKTFQSSNKRRTKEELAQEFEKYKNVLIQKGFLEEKEDGIFTTEKGKMLSKCHGYNNLTLCEMINNEELKNLDALELASFAGAMTAERVENKDDKKDDKIYAQTLVDKCLREDGEAPLIEALDKAMDFDDEMFAIQKRAKIEDIDDYATGIFESYITYDWVKRNSLANNNTSIKNFRLLGDELLGKKSKYRALSPYSVKKFEDGNLYRILAQSIDVLKQIINICEYKLEETYCENEEYYQNLLEKSQQAIELIKQPPVHDALSIG